MRLKTALGTMATACALLATSFAAVPMLISHQGRLLGSGGVPVTGTRDITFHIYGDSTGGLPLWTEAHLDVPVSNGLFKVNLGDFLTIEGDLFVVNSSEPTARYLEVQVEADPPLSPRVRLVAAPYAVAASRVSGDIETSSGAVTIRALPDPDYLHESFMRSSSTGNEISMLDSSKTDHSSVRATWTTSNPGIGTVSGGALNMEVDDGDGVPDAEVSLEAKSGPTVRGSLTISSGALGAVGVPYTLFDATADLADVTLEMSVDSDNNGNNENWLFGNTTISGASHLVAGDLDQDGLEDLVVSSKVTGVSSELFVQAGELEPGTSSALFTVTGQPSPVGEAYNGTYMKSRMSIDDDGDGVHNRWIEEKCDSFEASSVLTVDTDGDGHADGQANIAASLNGNTVIGTLTDFNDDGVPDIAISSSTSVDRAILESFFERGDKPTQSQFSNLLDSDGISTTARSANQVGVPKDGNYLNRVTPDSVDEISTVSDGSSSSSSSTRLRLNQLENTLQNIGLLARTSVKQDCDDDDAGLEISAGVAIPKFLEVNAKAQTATQKAAVGMVMGSGPDTTIEIRSEDSSSSLKLRLPTGNAQEGVLTTEMSWKGAIHQMTWDSDADGIVDRRFTGDCDDENTGLEISAGVAIPKFINMTARDASSLPGSSSDVSLVMGMGPDTAIDMRVTPHMNRSIFASQNTQSLRQVSITVDDTSGRVAIDTIPTTHKLSIGGGGAFCDGTTWTNASDKNAKENFSDVDGAELLEKIEELPISQWNYKSEDESITHIGPTAQDFKALFGVGADDKSISTVDPSGIALAAIKELNKQNQELAKQNKDLKIELENLKKKVDELISRR